MDHRHSRRSFLKSGSALAGLASLGPSSLLAHDTQPEAPRAPLVYRYPNPGKVVVVEHPGAVLGVNNVDAAVVQFMFDEGIKRLTGITSSPAEALASVFPGLTTSKKIAIKPNFLNSTVPTRKELTKAVITRLVQMLGGFPASNITVYERHTFSSVGYTTSYFGQAVNLVYDATFPNLGYTIHCNGVDRPYSKSLHDADYLINMPVAKDHFCSSAFGFTLAFKNHMGTLNPGGSVGVHCDKTAMLDVMADNVMTSKQRLIVLDALYAIYNGGPSGSPQSMPKKIYISQDPVTIDAQGRLLLNGLRTQNNLSTKSGSYIDEAAASPYNIGIADPALMTVINLYYPVRLSLFTASLANDAVTVRWATEEERNNAGFAIERRNGEEGAWTQIGFIAGAGTTGERREYRFEDRPGGLLDTVPCLSYRLKQIDTDGRHEYSSSVSVITRRNESDWLLEQNYPNPFERGTDIPVYLPRAAELKVEVFDDTGRRVALVAHDTMPAGMHYFHWDSSAVSHGVYHCRAWAEGRIQEISMIVIKWR
jgi:uncharacterized protein (DUF362 family)